MSVLIRGMEMPKACWECPLKVHLFQQLWCTPSNKVIDMDDNTEREPDCLLVEEPRGMLDGEKAIQMLDKTFEEITTYNPGTVEAGLTGAVIDVVKAKIRAMMAEREAE